MNCGTCKCWNSEGFSLAKNGNRSPVEENNEPAGSCRRYAPSARQGNWRSWPTTLQSDFCHDYVEKPKVVEKVAEAEVPIPVIVVPESFPKWEQPAKKAGRPKKSIDTKSGKV